MKSRMITLCVAVSVYVSACAPISGTVRQDEPGVGPAYSSDILEREQAKDTGVVPAADKPDRPRLDIIVPVFDPGLPEDLSTIDKDDRIWPELRRAEANLFAYKMKRALEDTGVFGAVRVAPDRGSTGDLYVLGRIEESTGEAIEIDIKAIDISDRQWLDESFSHTVPEDYFSKSENKGKDPYEPVFTRAARAIVEELQEQENKTLETLKQITEIRFAASFSEEAFSRYLKHDANPGLFFWKNQGNITLAGLPSEEDPMLQRVRSLRIRDQLFIDRMQNHYELFSQRMSNSYAIWQEGSHAEVIALREARQKAAGQAILGALLIAGAAYASSNNNNYNPATTTAAVVAGVGGVMLLSKSIQTNEEASYHENALAELGNSLNIELEPQVVEFENKTVQLTGDANQQFNQWRAFLKQIFLAESAPEVQL